MTVQECYEEMGADYNDVLSRLRTDERIVKFLLRVYDDGSFKLLESSLAEKNIPEAFRAAHTLKGVCMNLSLTALFKSSNLLTESLRNRTEYGEDIVPLFEHVKSDYEKTMNCILKLKNENNL